MAATLLALGVLLGAPQTTAHGVLEQLAGREGLVLLVTGLPEDTMCTVQVGDLLQTLDALEVECGLETAVFRGALLVRPRPDGTLRDRLEATVPDRERELLFRPPDSQEDPDCPGWREYVVETAYRLSVQDDSAEAYDIARCALLWMAAYDVQDLLRWVDAVESGDLLLRLCVRRQEECLEMCVPLHGLDDPRQPLRVHLQGMTRMWKRAAERVRDDPEWAADSAPAAGLRSPEALLALSPSEDLPLRERLLLAYPLHLRVACARSVDEWIGVWSDAENTLEERLPDKDREALWAGAVRLRDVSDEGRAALEPTLTAYTESLAEALCAALPRTDGSLPLWLMDRPDVPDDSYTVVTPTAAETILGAAFMSVLARQGQTYWVHPLAYRTTGEESRQ